MNAVAEAVGTTVTSQKIREFLASQDTKGRFLLSIGAISQAQFDAGEHQLEDFKVKLIKDPDLARKAEKDPYEAVIDTEGQLGDPNAVAALEEVNAIGDADDEEALQGLFTMLCGEYYEDDEDAREV